MDFDEDEKPEWMRYIDERSNTDRWGDDPNNDGWPTDEAEQYAWLRGSAAEYGCPFAWLLGYTITPIYD